MRKEWFSTQVSTYEEEFDIEWGILLLCEAVVDNIVNYGKKTCSFWVFRGRVPTVGIRNKVGVPDRNKASDFFKY